MGLLDEAIRDHLELKRRRGADPSEIAQAEQEALEPVFPTEDQGADEASGPEVGEMQPDTSLDGAQPEPQAHAEVRAPITDSAVSHGELDGEAPPASEDSPAFSSVGQETAEIDMRAVLDEHTELVTNGASPETPGAIDDELMEWESPRSELGPQSQTAASDGAAPTYEEPQIPGQERLTFD
jgi:hypothetical protein